MSKNIIKSWAPGLATTTKKTRGLEKDRALIGVEKFDEQIKKLIEQLGADKVEPILLDALTIIADDARNRAPKGPTGNLKKGIRATLLKRIGDNPAAGAGVHYKIARHAHLVEYGTSERIGKKGAESYRGRSFGKMPAHPFLRPAWDFNKDRVFNQIKEELKKLVESICQ